MKTVTQNLPSRTLELLADPMIPSNRATEPTRGSNRAGNPSVLTISEVACQLRCSKAHVSHILHGKVSGVTMLPHIALGRRILVRAEWLVEWIETNRAGC